MEIWEMSFEEYSGTVLTKVIYVREKSIEQWALENGIAIADVTIGSAELGNAIGSMIFPTPNRTATQAGKERSWQKEYLRKTALQKRYQEEVPDVPKDVPIDLTKESDQAYLRVRYRKALRQAIRQGKCVPEENLKFLE